uniref:hypothetical protein n=1 Tax=Halobaculum gomorrense TaxID=43928 RepID=UPI00135638DC|nr:hypothetical protein [Halobaculum gomorrense]
MNVAVSVAEDGGEALGDVRAAVAATSIGPVGVESGRHSPHPDAVWWQLHCAGWFVSER